MESRSPQRVDDGHINQRMGHPRVARRSIAIDQEIQSGDAHRPGIVARSPGDFAVPSRPCQPESHPPNVSIGFPLVNSRPCRESRRYCCVRFLTVAAIASSLSPGV